QYPDEPAQLEQFGEAALLIDVFEAPALRRCRLGDQIAKDALARISRALDLLQCLVEFALPQWTDQRIGLARGACADPPKRPDSLDNYGYTDHRDQQQGISCIP